MSLTLTVLTYRNQPPPRAISKTFLGAGGTIGRLEQNDLILPDPERTISRTHARVEFRDGAYFVTGLGQNPIELNGRLMAPGSSAKLAAGDRLVVGEYCIVAELAVPMAFQASDLGAVADAGGLQGLDDLVPGTGGGGLTAFGIDLSGGSSSPAPSSDMHRLSNQQPLANLGLQRDQVPGFQEPLPSNPMARIPDDYDLLRDLDEVPPAGTEARPGEAPAAPGRPILDDPFAEAGPPAVPVSWEQAPAIAPEPKRPSPPAKPSQAPAAAPPRPVRTEGDSLRTETDSPPPVAAQDYAQAVRALLQAAGVPELEDHALADPDFARTVGELLRESIAGLLKALLARALTKRELRVDMTMLSTTENNPLKFSPDASEALTHLFVNRPRKGYLPPVRAVQEAYDDLQAHNLAVMAGTRAALLEVLQRFDPARLEKRLGANPLLDKLLPQNRKARMWDLIAEQHADLVREAQDEFDRLFGRAFRAAYEEQLRKLRAASGKGTPR
jgi:type VI secretion system FHA domain protein